VWEEARQGSGKKAGQANLGRGSQRTLRRPGHGQLSLTSCRAASWRSLGSRRARRVIQGAQRKLGQAGPGVGQRVQAWGVFVSGSVA